MGAVNLVLLSLAVLTSFACMVLLFRAYFANGQRLLLWSALCFVFLSVNNLLVFADVLVFPDVDLRVYRLVAALAGIVFLLYGFIQETE